MHNRRATISVKLLHDGVPRIQVSIYDGDEHVFYLWAAHYGPEKGWANHSNFKESPDMSTSRMLSSEECERVVSRILNSVFPSKEEVK